MCQRMVCKAAEWTGGGAFLKLPGTVDDWAKEPRAREDEEEKEQKPQAKAQAQAQAQAARPPRKKKGVDGE